MYREHSPQNPVHPSYLKAKEIVFSGDTQCPDFPSLMEKYESSCFAGFGNDIIQLAE
jgi:hypothetical protein